MCSLSIFSHEIKYKRGSEVPHVASLIGNCGNQLDEMQTTWPKMTEEENKETVRQIQLEILHRGIKTISYELRKRKVVFEKKNAIIKKVPQSQSLEICKNFNTKKAKKFVFVAVCKWGDKIAMDIIGSIGETYITMVIVYFIRKG